MDVDGDWIKQVLSRRNHYKYDMHFRVDKLFLPYVLKPWCLVPTRALRGDPSSSCIGGMRMLLIRACVRLACASCVSNEFGDRERCRQPWELTCESSYTECIVLLPCRNASRLSDLRNHVSGRNGTFFPRQSRFTSDYVRPDLCLRNVGLRDDR